MLLLREFSRDKGVISIDYLKEYLLFKDHTSCKTARELCPLVSERESEANRGSFNLFNRKKLLQCKTMRLMIK